MEIIFARASDIPCLIHDGIIDLGITGQDLVAEKRANVESALALDFGHAKLILAASKEMSREILLSKPLKIATSYPVLTRIFCLDQGIRADIIDLSGAVELAPKLGLADAIVDLSSSGETLRMNDLYPLWTILETQACLFSRKEISIQKKEWIDQVVMALESVIRAQEQKFLIANFPTSNLQMLSQVASGLSGPTVMSILGRKDLCAIQIVINTREVAGVINKLKRLGASGILVTNIEQMVT